MNRYTLRAAAVLLACLMAWPSASAQQAPQEGSCLLGRAEKDLDVNNALARVFNTGSLFFGNSSEAAYLVPQASGNSPIYASGIWIAGEVDGELRVAGATYNDYEFWPGPLGDDARPVNPSDCSEYDRIWKVSRGDILTYDGSGIASPDLASWPAELGAPVIDGDGNPDNYNLAGGDRPEILGDQGVWWIMNDVGNVHRNNGTPPLGVEVRVLAWAFSRSDALGETTFYRYTVENKTDFAIEDTYLSIFSDPDLGDAVDDYVGSDPELGLGFVYNANDEDAVYGVPPAAGYDFFQGPIVPDGDDEGTDPDTLGSTVFMYFSNASGPQADPQDAEGYYNFMRGLWADGSQMTASGDGLGDGGEVTVFAYPGDPVTGEFWSEENTDGNGTANTPGDRRFLVSTGPFTLEPNTPQDIVFGIVFGQGGDRLSSISALRAADRLAQTAYDIDFQLPPPPPSPPACVPGSADPQLRPGSGTCAEAVGQDEAITLVWGYPSNSANYLGAFVAEDQLVAAGGTGEDPFYEFEGFNIYRYPTSAFDQTQATLIATYDKINGVTQIIDSETNPVTQREDFFIAANGTDNGLEYTLTIANVTNYSDYYYGISAYAYNEASIPKVLESAPTQIVARPSKGVAGNGGTVINADRGTLVAGQRQSGAGIAGVSARVVDPTQLTGATYTLEFVEVDADNDAATPDVRTYIIRRGNEVVFDGPAQAADGVVTAFDSQNIVIDGLQFFTRDFDIVGDLDEQPDISGATDEGPGADGVVELSYGDIEATCPDPNDPDDPGCELYGVGNSVFLTGNVNDDYYIDVDNATGVQRLRRYAASIAPYDAEIRFTDGPNWGLTFGSAPDGAEVWSVPFELWNVGTTPDDPSDDIRMIPFIIQDGDTFDWENDFPRTDTGAGTLQATNRIYWMMPDRANGYDLFAQAAAAAGVGNPYVDTDVTDTPIDPDNLFVGDIDPTTGEVCSNTGGYVSFCYRNDQTSDLTGAQGEGGTFVYGIGRTVFVDLAEDGTTPPSGTVVRFITTKGELLAAGDVITFDTSALAPESENAAAAQEALELIAAVPNPYLGTSAYESDNTDRVIRFTNLPDIATIRIFTVNGSLVRRINKEGPSRSADWDLTTENNLPAASGMYFVHIEVPGVGDRVIKLGVVNRQTEVTTF